MRLFLRATRTGNILAETGSHYVSISGNPLEVSGYEAYFNLRVHGTNRQSTDLNNLSYNDLRELRDFLNKTIKDPE